MTVKYIREIDEEQHIVSHKLSLWKNDFVINVTETGDKDPFYAYPSCSIQIKEGEVVLLNIPLVQNRKEFHHISTLLVELYEMVMTGVLDVSHIRHHEIENSLEKFYSIISPDPIYLQNKPQPLLFDGIPWFKHEHLSVVVARQHGIGGTGRAQLIKIFDKGDLRWELHSFPTQELKPLSKEEVIFLLPLYLN